MLTLEIVITIVLFLHVLLQLVLFLANRTAHEEKGKLPEELPLVSILVPARNEEANIERCLSSILSMDYPKDKYEVLIGDDASSDNTATVVEKFIGGDYILTLIKNKENL